jgi:hypothetical protein
MHVDRQTGLKGGGGTLPISQNPETVIFVCYILSHSCHSAALNSIILPAGFSTFPFHRSHCSGNGTTPSSLSDRPHVLQYTYISKHILALILSGLIWTQFLQPWRWKHHASPKHQYQLHSYTLLEPRSLHSTHIWQETFNFITLYGTDFDSTMLPSETLHYDTYRSSAIWHFCCYVLW